MGQHFKKNLLIEILFSNYIAKLAIGKIKI